MVTIFKTEIQIWVNFGVSYNGRCWYILGTFGIFCGNLVNSVPIWYIFPRFGMLRQVKSGHEGLHCCRKKIWETAALVSLFTF
jgi:hypothetical protein